MSPRLLYSWAVRASSLAEWKHLRVDCLCQDFIKSWQGKSTFQYLHQENKEAVLAHFTSLGAFKCVHLASGAGILYWNVLEPSSDVIVAAREQGEQQIYLEKTVLIIWSQIFTCFRHSKFKSRRRKKWFIVKCFENVVVNLWISSLFVQETTLRKKKKNSKNY